MTLPHLPEKDSDLWLEIDRRIANLEGKIGSGLSHKDLLDTEDHKTFLRQDGSVPVTGTLDFQKSGRIVNSANRILDVDIYRGSIILDVPANQLTLETGLVSATVDHGLLIGLVDDDHIQYALLVGRAGGQTLIGGINSGDDLTLNSTSHVTKGSIFFGSSTGMIWDEENKRLSFLNEENEIIINGTTFGETVAIHGLSDTVIQLGLHRHSNTAIVGASIDGQRSRGAEGAETIVQDGDNLLDVIALGFDGTDYIIAARLDIEVDGTPGNNDMPGRFIFRTTPDGGVSAIERWRIDQEGGLFSPKAKISVTGGYAVKLTNKTGANTIKGQVVKADTATDDAVVLAGASDDEAFGVFLDAGIADGSEAWVVISGIVDVAFDDNVAAVRGNWIGTGVLAGYVRTQASPPALGIAAHFEEIGHVIESVAAGGGGTHILARCVIHFN